MTTCRWHVEFFEGASRAPSHVRRFATKQGAKRLLGAMLRRDARRWLVRGTPTEGEVVARQLDGKRLVLRGLRVPCPGPPACSHPPEPTQGRDERRRAAMAREREAHERKMARELARRKVATMREQPV